jgi:hypothetical protein
VAVATAGAAVFLAASPAATAASEDWNSRSDPLIAWEDGDAQALAYGTAYTKEGSLKNHTYYRDPRAGGDAVYTETAYDTYVQEADGTTGWRGKCCKDQSSRSDSGLWRDQYDAYYYASISTIEKGRVYYKVCEDQSWSPDACSVNPFITFQL